MKDQRITVFNYTYPNGGVSCSKDSFVVNQTLVFQIKFCGKSPAHRVAAKLYTSPYEKSVLKLINNKNEQKNKRDRKFNHTFSTFVIARPASQRLAKPKVRNFASAQHRYE